MAAAHLASAANPQIISTQVGDEHAVRVAWESESNAIYAIDYASQLVISNTQWRRLCLDYPSHGTNTFWLDTGDYLQTPAVPHPRRGAMRFYRVAKTGTNTGAAPFVQVTSPVSNAVLSGEVTVSLAATSALPALYLRLYVDGQEMPSSDDRTNFVINTCEWANGPHVLFACAKAQSQWDGVSGPGEITYGRAVSAYVPVTFDSYISEFYFSEPLFEPAIGETQRITATFKAYSDWTLQIVDQSSNIVRTATGSGQTMSFGWDGTADGGISIPNGVYEYVLTANESTESPRTPIGGQEQGAETSLLGALVQTRSGFPEAWYPTSAKEALAVGLTSYFTRPPPMPPILIAGRWHAWEEVYGSVRPIEVQIPLRVQEAYVGSNTRGHSTVLASGALAGSFTARGPTKPPTAPVKGNVGTFGVAYFTFPNGLTNEVPRDQWGEIELEGTTNPRLLAPVPSFAETATTFAAAMTKGGWKESFRKDDQDLLAIELKRNDLGIGGSNLFNSVNIGLFMSHGCFGTAYDVSPAAAFTLQTYFGVGGSNPPNSWIRLSEFQFGGNLRWMAILACNALRPDNYDDMDWSLVLPISEDLHLLLSGSTVLCNQPDIGNLWAKKMLGSKTVAEAWFEAGTKAYQNQPPGSITNVIRFRVAGWPSCFGDRLKSYSAPDGDTIEYIDTLVAQPQ